MHSSALLLVLKVQQNNSALLVGDRSSRAEYAASSFTNKALRSSNLGSSRSSVNHGTTGQQKVKRCKTFTTSTQGRPTHPLGTRKYPLQGEESMELQLIKT